MEYNIFLGGKNIDNWKDVFEEKMIKVNSKLKCFNIELNTTLKKKIELEKYIVERCSYVIYYIDSSIDSFLEIITMINVTQSHSKQIYIVGPESLTTDTTFIQLKEIINQWSGFITLCSTIDQVISEINSQPNINLREINIVDRFSTPLRTNGINKTDTISTDNDPSIKKYQQCRNELHARPIIKTTCGYVFTDDNGDVLTPKKVLREIK